jgi:hypothetical protein
VYDFLRCKIFSEKSEESDNTIENDFANHFNKIFINNLHIQNMITHLLRNISMTNGEGKRKEKGEEKGGKEKGEGRREKEKGEGKGRRRKEGEEGKGRGEDREVRTQGPNA